MFATVWGLMQFLCSPLLGALSDRYGRRPVILISCLGLGLDYIFMAVAPSLTLLFIGRIISGITAATISTAFAYIADVTPEDGRAKAFGVVGLAFGLGFVLGPAIGGLLGGLDPRLPFWVSAAACLINAAFGWFVLPESLPPERRMAFAWARANPLGSLRLLGSHRQLLGLAVVDFIVNVAHQVLPSVFVLYAAFRYGWDETAVGLTLAFVGVCSALVQGLVVGPATAWLGSRGALIAGMLFGSLGMVIYGLAPTGPWFLLGVPVMALWGLVGPDGHGHDEPQGEPVRAGPAAGRQQLLAQRRRDCSARPSSPRPSPGCSTGCPAHRSCSPRCCWSQRRRVAWIVTAPPPDAGRARVSLQTSQSGFSGLLNHGSAQPRSRQRRTMAAATSWPSRSNSGSLPPGWVSPRRRYRISGRVGRSPSNSLSFNAKASSERASWRTIWRSANTAASPSDDAGKGLSPNPSFDEKPGKIRWLPPFPATST